MRRTVALVLNALVAAGGAPAATKPAALDPLVEAAVAAVDAGSLPAFAESVEKAAAEALSNLETGDVGRLTQLATLREFARWFGRVPSPPVEQRAALRWLVRQGRTAPELLLAATRHDPPDRALAILAALHKDSGDRLEQFPELTAAVCLVWDDPDRSGGEGRPLDAARVVRVFRYYADHPGSTRGAATELPVDQLIFVVDNLLSDAEIDWVRRQAATLNVGSAFFEVGYGPTRELTRAPLKPGGSADNAYTLANLRRFGGRLGDQAYYAAQVGKALGIPTATCAGPAGEGQEAAAWVAFLQGRGRDARWDTTSGRYRLHLASPGEVSDPQTMESVPQGELALVAGVGRTSVAKRAGAAALAKLLDLAPAAQQLAVARRAAELSPSDRRTWRRIADWAQQHAPETDEHRAVVELISSQLAPRAEDVALDLRLRMIAELAAENRAAALADLRAAFAGRSDLTALIQLARARALLEKKDQDGALRVLGQLLGNVETIPVQAVEAVRLVDDILRERSELDRLAVVYQQVWSRLRQPPPSPVAHTTPYAAIGQEYAQLLEELGRKHELTSVRERLAELWAEPVRR